MRQGSITVWLQEAQQGNSEAAQELWERYHRRLLGLARHKMRDLPRRVVDEEDVVQHVFDRFFTGMEKGQFPQLADRDDLWRVLVMLTARQSINEFHRQTRQKRGGGNVRGESVFANPDGPRGIDDVVGEEPTAEFAASVVENVQRLLNCITDSALKQLAEWKMEGLTNQQLAQRCDCSERTVQRKMHRIRVIWTEELGLPATE